MASPAGPYEEYRPAAIPGTWLLPCSDPRGIGMRTVALTGENGEDSQPSAMSY